MASQYLIKYSTFDELLDSVRDDFETYEAEGFIDSSKLIRVVKNINKKLGLKLHKDNEIMLEVNNFKAQLPDDFYKLNFATMCHSYKVVQPKIEGTYTEEFWVNLGCKIDPCDPCYDKNTISLPDTCANRCKMCVGKNGQDYTILQRFRNEVREYSEMSVCKIKATSPDCLSDKYISGKSPYDITIQDNYIYTNFDGGAIYVSYVGDLVDTDNNLLVLDHPLVNEYYEYAIKRRILENMFLDLGEDVAQKLQLVEMRYREAKKTAHRLVDTPEFSELDQIWRINRNHYYNRFYLPITGKL